MKFSERHFCLAVLIAVTAVSCSPARKIIREPIREHGEVYLFGEMKKNELRFNWFSARFSSDYIVDNKKTQFSGQIRIRKDSLIWISIMPALGIEAARATITADSIKFINRLNNTYIETDFGYINQQFNTNFDFDLLQSYLLGNDVSYYENDIFKASIDEKQYKLSTIGRHKLKKYIRTEADSLKVLIQNIWMDPASFKITKVTTKEIKKENRKLEAVFSDFNPVDSQVFPHTVHYIMSAEKDFNIFIEYSKVKLDEPQTFPFKVPEKYKKIQ